MAKSKLDNRRASFRASPLTFLIFVGIGFMSFDFVAIERQPLRYLHVPYPSWFDYSALLFPAACATAWLLLRRRWPIWADIVSFVMCVALVALIPTMFKTRVRVIPLGLYPGGDAGTQIEQRLGFPVFFRNSSNVGATATVAPAHEAAARVELARLGRLR